RCSRLFFVLVVMTWALPIASVRGRRWCHVDSLQVNTAGSIVHIGRMEGDADGTVTLLNAANSENAT
ncbi:hypothetical protein R3Q06_36565, partial [Rhodococcus erythropolis]|uniref:hypothetical protein n=1 Tax=Rhodococcus erythropolis TaxID=1833 RepID=UPI00294A84B2